MPKVNFDIPLDFLQTKTPPMIGVDISASSVKMVELSQSPKKDGYIVERYAIELLPKDALTDGNINNLEAVSEGGQWPGLRHACHRTSYGTRR